MPRGNRAALFRVGAAQGGCAYRTQSTASDIRRIDLSESRGLLKFTQAGAEIFTCQRLEAFWFDDPIRCCAVDGRIKP